MEWFIAAVAVVALGVAAVVAAGGGGSMPVEPVRDTYAMAVRDEPLDAADVRHLRFGVALRGYAMDQVDAILDRLALELEARDARIAELSRELEPRPEGSVEQDAEADLAGETEVLDPVADGDPAVIEPPVSEPAPVEPTASGWEPPR